MLTSFLEKYRPVNFIFFGSIVFLSGFFNFFTIGEAPFSWILLLFFLLQFLICLFSIFILNFLITKNVLTQSNNFALFLYSGFLAMNPEVFYHIELNLSHLFLLLAFRRMISLVKNTNPTKKILDSAIWISIAALFNFWSILFFIPLWLAIIHKPESNYKQMLMPFVGFIMIFLIVTAYYIIVDNSFSWIRDWSKSISWDFSNYNQLRILFPATVISVFIIWSTFWRFFNYASISFKDKLKHALLFYITIAFLGIVLTTSEKTGAELIFIFTPVAIMTANYLESKQAERNDKTEKLFRELLLWLVLGLILISFFI